MLFADYVNVLKRHFKKTMSVQKLCTLLFDIVMDNATLGPDEQPPVEIGKDRISKMMNGKESIHLFIRDHIYDDSVVENMIDSFEKSIIPLLIDDSDDLCFQLMEIINTENISPSHKTQFKLLAKKETLAPFLADVFIFAISTNTTDSIETVSDTNNERVPIFKIRGIANKRVTDELLVRPIVERIGSTKESIKNNITNLVEKTKSLHAISPVNNLIDNKFDFLSEKYEYEGYKKELIQKVCKALKIELPNDFFDVGDMREHYLSGMDSMGLPCSSLSGSPESEEKLRALNDIYEAIQYGNEMFPVINATSYWFYVELVIDNIGSDYDEDIRVVLKFPKDSIVDADTIMEYESETIVSLVEHEEFLMDIERGEDYLSYEDEQFVQSSSPSYPMMSKSFNLDKTDVEDFLGYYISKGKDYDLVEVEFKSLNQHTAIAFPKVILLKKTIDQIHYTLRSKRIPDVLDGVLKVKTIQALADDEQ